MNKRKTGVNYFNGFCSAILLLSACSVKTPNYFEETKLVLKDSVLLLAQQYAKLEPVTVTADSCVRSTGGVHDFFSEGDYWWPDPENPTGKYIRKDGMTNPGNFTKHREALFRFSEVVGNLGSAYVLTHDQQYANAILKHCKAWFVDEHTKMNPNLLYAQAIQGRYTGRGIGIIDAIHLMEVVQALRVLEKHNALPAQDVAELKSWFTQFTHWLTSHPYGIKEMNAKNNHGTCWNMQVAVYARFIQNDSILDACRQRYKEVLLPNQMAADGSFPLEMGRTKPYGYALFNLDAMGMNCVALSDAKHDVWAYTTKDGRSIKRALDYMLPFVLDKSEWVLPPDVMYWQNWPVAQPAFIFGAAKYGNKQYFKAWKMHKHFFEVQEIKRNVPIRNPLIWLEP